MLLYGITIYSNFNIWIYSLHVVVANADYTLNGILLMLQYSVCDKQYYRFCHKCDLLCKYCFRNQFTHFKHEQNNFSVDIDTSNNNSKIKL